jgi:hypothetical protein
VGYEEERERKKWDFCEGRLDYVIYFAALQLSSLNSNKLYSGAIYSGGISRQSFLRVTFGL